MGPSMQVPDDSFDCKLQVFLRYLQYASIRSFPSSNLSILWATISHSTMTTSSPKKKSAKSLPLEKWVFYRFGLIAARVGSFAAPMYAERHDLTTPAWRCLAVIARHEKLSAKELASKTSADAFKIARAIDLLVRRNLITRNPDPLDRRRASLQLTAEGWEVYHDVEQFAIRIEERLVATLSKQELAQMEAMLEKIDEQVEVLRLLDWRSLA
jgi:DNA-binding MarR family transcriptional regulator